MESPSAYHVSHVEVRQEEGSRLSFTTVNTGGLLVRNDLNVLLAGERCEATLNGLTLVDGDRHVDNHTAIDHASPNCESHELYKAVLDGRSRSVFNGKIFVRPGAQNTDAKQTNRSLMLSPQATVNTKPQLEIFADDVKCTHGATVGQLRDEEVFYLRSRGMSEETARQLLTYGFANEIVERIRLQPVRAFLDRLQMSTLHTTFVSEG
jgi:Fe-S cluster assembly protein SufD